MKIFKFDFIWFYDILAYMRFGVLGLRFGVLGLGFRVLLPTANCLLVFLATGYFFR